MLTCEICKHGIFSDQPSQQVPGGTVHVACNTDGRQLTPEEVQAVQDKARGLVAEMARENPFLKTAPPVGFHGPTPEQVKEVQETAITLADGAEDKLAQPCALCGGAEYPNETRPVAHSFRGPAHLECCQRLGLRPYHVARWNCKASARTLYARTAREAVEAVLAEDWQGQLAGGAVLSFWVKAPEGHTLQANVTVHVDVREV